MQKKIKNTSYNFVLIFLLLCLVPLKVKAQKNNQSYAPPYHYVEEKKANLQFVNIPLNKNANIPTQLIDILQKQIKHLNKQQFSLQYTHTVQSQLGTHYHFKQQLMGYPIFSAAINCLVNDEKNLIHWTDNTFDVTIADLNTRGRYINQLHTKLEQQAKILTKEFGFTDVEKANIEWFFDDISSPELTYILTASNNNGQKYYQYAINENGDVLYQRDVQHYFASPTAAPPQTTASAKVFMPNPIVSAGVVYGQNGQYRNNNNNDASELTDELVDVEVDVTLDGSTFVLRNDAVRIEDFEAPVIPPVSSSTPEFNFTRSQTGFEDVNAFYHISEFYAYLQSLGVDYMNGVQVRVDAHAINGDDQSFHSFNQGTHSIRFGGGNPSNPHVDDAEDADVVIHEYGHAISQEACPNCNFGTERNALDEALCDYLATSYRRPISNHNWENVFAWDGHNEFWAGRNIGSDKRYPEDNINSFYYRSEIFSSVLMEIYNEIGKDATDRILLNAMSLFSSNIDLAQAAELLLLSESVLYDGIYTSDLSKFLATRGLIPYAIDAGEDKIVACLGDEVELGIADFEVVDAVIYWSPGLSLNDSTLSTPTATPDGPGTTIYTLTVRDLNTGQIFTDNMQVTVLDYCLNPPNGSEIVLLNTDLYARRRGNLLIEVPVETQNVRLRIFNAQGQLIEDVNVIGDARIEITPSKYPAGVYLLKVQADDKEKVFKIGNVR